jgi:hypothetical protein
MILSSKHEKILSLIEAVEPLIQLEIEKGDQAVDSVRSLSFIKSRLGEMARMLRAKTVVKDERYKGSMGRLVVDTWPINHPLGSKITAIEYEFYRLPNAAPS